MNEKLERILFAKHTRIELVTRSLYWFGRYYFREFFHHQSPAFHKDLIRCLEFKNSPRYLIAEMFKESAKTSWAKIAVAHKIATKQKRFIGYVCHDKSKAEAALYDIAIQLQTNKRLIEDFGQLFYEPNFSEEKKTKKKSIDEFITSNQIKVKAYSTAQSTRGEVHGAYRPDFFVLDDFENEITKKSAAKTKEVISFIEELLSGISANANIVFLCNKISTKGSVNYLEIKAKGNKDFILLKVPLITKGKINWKSKFKLTDKDADEVNALISSPEKKVFSIEERKRTLGTARFNQEYQLQPINDEESIIKKDWIYKNTYSTLDQTRMQYVIAFDPQAGESKAADSYGLCVMGFYPKDRHRYVLLIQSGKSSQLEQAALLVRTWLNFPNALLVGVEKVINQVAVYQLILEWKAGLNVFDPEKYPDLQFKNRNIPLKALEPRGRDGGIMKDKTARLQIHEPSIERGELHFHQTMTDFMDKLCAFPDVEHDDDIDSLIYAYDMSYSAGVGTRLDPEKNNNMKSNNIVGNILNERF